MKHLKKIGSLFLLIVLFACQEKEPTNNLIKVQPGDNLNEIVRKSTLVVPTEKQYDWQQLEFTAFIHFGPNTFTGVEWGNGMEDPTVFHPTDLDASQWVSVMKAAGMKLAMLTAKHHDGFCLWPTTTSKHSVKSSGWRNGQGDVLGELVKEARKEGIEIGVYLSPADLHEIEREGGTYGNGSKLRKVKIPSDQELRKQAKQVFEYKLDDYNVLFLNQLYEVLTQYGKIREVWFDGANPKPGTGQTYDRKSWYDMIRKLQPEALIAIKGPDVRWCGNEAGKTRKNEWSVLPVAEHPDIYDWPDLRAEDLGSRDKMEGAKYLYWYPAETNTSIRHGWFYRDDEQHVKSVEELVDTWYRSVGGNTVFLLNRTPDRRGLIPEKDASRLREVGAIISQSFKRNLVEQASIQDAGEETSAKNILDGNAETYWKPTDGNEQAELVLTFDGEKEFNRLVLQECIKSQGQRIEEFAFDIWKDGKWAEITNGTVVGYKNIRRFPLASTSKVRIRILKSRMAPTLSTVGLFKSPELLTNPYIVRNKECLVEISCKSPDPNIYYTTDGTDPDLNSPVYHAPFEIPGIGMVKAVAVVDNGRQKSETIAKRFDVCPLKWKILAAAETHNRYPTENAIDGNPSTVWHTPWGTDASGHPHSITIDFSEKLALKGFYYQPRSDGSFRGICKQYKVELSNDGNSWRLAKEGVFDNIKNNPVKQEILFVKAMDGQYLRFTSLANVEGTASLSAAEIGVITKGDF